MAAPDLDHVPAPSRRLWVGAAVTAVVLHVGCGALALAQLDAAEPDDALGSPAIEIGLEMASPRSEPTDLPPGPDSDAAVASPAVQEQKAEIKETDLPKETPHESEEPDLAVTQNDNKKPVEEQPEVSKVQQTASTESVASEATAMPSTEDAPEATKSVAPAQGTGKSAIRLRTTWQRELVAHLDKHKRYPGERSQKNVELTISFELDRTGHVLSAAIVKGSGDTAFDEAALAMVKRSDPVPAPPPLVADEGLSFTLPVIFRVKGKG